MDSQTIPVSQYLFKRLQQLGAGCVFGVAGDYNLTLLDQVVPSGLKLVGNCNELNAGYAADGYSRVKGTACDARTLKNVIRLTCLGIGALITTFGVGELSAVNAIAGAYAERAPVVHIVGTPVRSSQESRALIHHTFNDGEYHHFDRMQEHVTVAQVGISDHRTAPMEIDRVLLQCLLHSRPVRITIPVDMVFVRVPTASLGSEIKIPPLVQQPQLEEKALSCVLGRIASAQRPMILVDGEIRAFGVVDEVESLIRLTEWPTLTSGYGKGLVNETLPNVHGVFHPRHKGFVDSCDLVLCFGPHYSNTNTFIFSAIPKAETSILFHSTSIQVDKEVFRDLPMKYFIQQVTSHLGRSKIPPHKPDTSQFAAPELPTVTPSDPVNQMAGFWQRVSPFFRSGDIVLAETGTAGYGAADFILPPDTQLFKPVTWLSIGYMLPATLGASQAQRDLLSSSANKKPNSGRTILFMGDGSFQMTAQELSTIIHQKLNVIVFLINNDGYTIERCIHGRNQQYNDLARWRYRLAPAFFGADEDGEFAARTWEIRTWADFDRVLSDGDLVNGKGLRLVEVFFDRFDGPDLLIQMLDNQIAREKQQQQ